MSDYSRRDFLKTGLAAGVLASAGTLPLHAERRTATDWVTLGRSDVKVTRLAFGTGSMSGRVQESLGQEGVTRLVRYAYDRGIRFFETSESYGAMPRMLGVALKGLPRDSYRIMNKVTTFHQVDPQALVRDAELDVVAELAELRHLFEGLFDPLLDVLDVLAVHHHFFGGIGGAGVEFAHVSAGIFKISADGSLHLGAAAHQP